MLRANMLQLDPPVQAGQGAVIVQAVPEPSALLLLASGLGPLAGSAGAARLRAVARSS